MSYELISPTAYTIAYLRELAGLPYAASLARFINPEQATREFYDRSGFQVDLCRMAKMASWVRLRSFSLNKAVSLFGTGNILEIAAGFSITGLSMTGVGLVEDPRVRYLETDLPAIIKQKEAAVKAMALGRRNLGFASVNALEPESLFTAAESCFPKGPLTIVMEGLFPYLTHAEKLQVASNVAAVLRKFGGVWITTDISLKENFLKAFNADGYSRKLRAVLADATGRDMADLAFASFEEAEELFRTAGFKVKRFSQAELAPELLKKEDIRNRRFLSVQQLWTIDLKASLC